MMNPVHLMKAPLDSRQLRAFCVLARTGSFTQTARELHLTQSAVSHSIKALELDVGCRLLDRLGKKIALTQAGEQLLHHAGRILLEMDRARESMMRLGQWGCGRLRIGASSTACQHIVPKVLREFKDSFPQHIITIEPGDTPALVGSLLRHSIDLALALESENDPQLDFHFLFTDELRFMVGAMHPWARTGRANRADLGSQSFITYSRNSFTFRLVEKYFREEGVALNTVIELGSMEAAKELVKLGLGICVLAPWVAQKELQEGSLVGLPLGRRKLERRWGILHRRGRHLGLAEETFIGLCESATVGLRSSGNQAF